MQESQLNSLIKFFLLHYNDLNTLTNLRQKALLDYTKNYLSSSEHCDIESFLDYCIFKLENEAKGN